MTLRKYQEDLLINILEKLKVVNKLCVQLSTGGGKTVIFTELINRLNSKTLILVDSIDLLEQTVTTFQKKGLDIGSLKAGNKMPNNMVVVAMVATLNNRLKKNKGLLNDFNYCVVDECHIWIFNKIFPFLKNAKVIGFTATPVRLKRYKIDYCDNCKDEVPFNECPVCGTETVEASRVETMSDVYDDIVIGENIEYLIKNGYLTQDENKMFDFDLSGLKTDASGEFTATSMKEVFQSEKYQSALLHNFKKECDGKKTLLFTSCTETNLIFSELFSDYNVKTYDSVNNSPSERDSIIDWFKNTKDAILINTGCFTKGFDVCDVEVIVMARATKSLSTWVQICGRGARITNKIYKESFLILDGGNNINEHGEFSQHRDWIDLFYNKKIKLKLLDVYNCEECGFMFDSQIKECPNCGCLVKDEFKNGISGKSSKEYIIQGQKSNVVPYSDIEFHLRNNHTKHKAFKVLKEKWINFLIKKNIEKKNWDYHIKFKTFDERFRVTLLPQYIKIINSQLENTQNVVYENYKNKILTESYKKKYGEN